MNNPIIWSDEEVKILREMSEAGFTCDEISVVLKSRNSDSIRSKALRMGITVPRNGYPEIDVEAFKRLMKGKK